MHTFYYYIYIYTYNGSNNKIYESSGLSLFTQFFNRDENECN